MKYNTSILTIKKNGIVEIYILKKIKIECYKNLKKKKEKHC